MAASSKGDAGLARQRLAGPEPTRPAPTRTPLPLLAQRLESIDTFSDHIQPGPPEVGRAQIEAEALGQFGGCGHAGARKQAFITSDESLRSVAIDREQPQTEEQTEGVGIVVEG